MRENPAIRWGFLDAVQLNSPSIEGYSLTVYYPVLDH